LRFDRNLRPHCFGEGKRVEHLLNFLDFCSTFEAARPDFEKSGIQKSDFPLCLCPFLDILTHGNETRLFLLISSITGNRACIHKKTGLDLQLIASHPGFQFEAEFFPAFKAAY